MTQMNDLLGLMAEIAVGFTGFAAIASALGAAPSEADQRIDRIRLHDLVEVGVMVVLMSLLPLVLFHTENGTDWGWTVSAVLLTASIVLLFFVQERRNRLAKASEMKGYSALGAFLNWAFGLSALVVLVLGLAAPEIIGLDVAYVSALWMAMVIVGATFIRVAASLLTHRFGGGS